MHTRRTKRAASGKGKRREGKYLCQTFLEREWGNCAPPPCQARGGVLPLGQNLLLQGLAWVRLLRHSLEEPHTKRRYVDPELNGARQPTPTSAPTSALWPIIASSVPRCFVVPRPADDDVEPGARSKGGEGDRVYAHRALWLLH